MNYTHESNWVRAAFVAARTTHWSLHRSAALGLFAAMLWLMALAPPVQAGPPNHVELSDPVNGFALNHACGTAVDSAGDIYVSNADEDKIEVFDSAGAHLTSISNSNEPCGLAVDSHGTLLVTEKGTGNVTRYVPGAQPPFSGAPGYDAAEVIDSSGEAAGIALDGAKTLSGSERFTGYEDSLFIAKGDHVDIYRNEKQQLSVSGSGTYTVEFEGADAELACSASHQELQEALEGLSTIGDGNVAVTTANFGATDHLIAFVGSLGLTNVSQLTVTGSCGISQNETNGGLIGPFLEDSSATYTGVAAYSFQVSPGNLMRYLYVANAADDQVEVFSGASLTSLKLRRAITGVDADQDGEVSSGEEFEFGSAGAGAYLAVDQGNTLPGEFEGGKANGKCVQVGKQACTAGHLLFYDAAAEVVQEFDATGRFLDRIESPEFADSEPTGMAIDRSGTASDGTIYVTAGNGPGAKLLAFKPLVNPSRSLLDGNPSGEPSLSRELVGAETVSIDPFGDVYVSTGSNVHIFDPQGNHLTDFEDIRSPYDLAVDSECNVYVADGINANKEVAYYDASACPPSSGTSFTRNKVLGPGQDRSVIAINPANDHLFLYPGGGEFPKNLIEYDSAIAGSGQVRECDAPSSGVDIAIYGGEDESETTVYIMRSGGGRELIAFDCGEVEGDEEVIAKSKGGGGCAGGNLGTNPAIAVDQSNGNVLANVPGQAGGVHEYDAALSCVAEFGQFAGGSVLRGAMAVDNGADSPNQGTVYVAYDGKNQEIQPYDLTAFGPLSYGSVPVAETGIASEVGEGNAILNGSVNPRGAELESCTFEYLLDSAYEKNLEDEDPPFQGATSELCAETPEDIGDGEALVEVHLDLSGLDPSEHYRYRLRAQSEFGQSTGKAWLFGPPLSDGERALPVFYDEATLRASVDPSGLETTYRFQYGTTSDYGQERSATLAPGDGQVTIKVPLTGLLQGTEYHFRLLASNEAGEYEGSDLTFETQQRLAMRPCPNTAYRTGLSAKLPDCRAYELVTPADMHGLVASAGQVDFNSAMIRLRGAGAGEVLSFGAGPLPGLGGTGDANGYRATRGPGAHPDGGWNIDLAGPNFAQLGVEGASGVHWKAVDPTQLYTLHTNTIADGTLPQANFLLRTPDGGFEYLGRGSLGDDPDASTGFLAPGGSHVIFTSAKHLEEGAAPEGTVSIYDRRAWATEAEVISVDPSGEPFSSDASYVAASEGGDTVLFEVGNALYAHRGGQTVEVISGAHSFAGVSTDGSRVYYTDSVSPEGAADLFACDLDTAGPCPGSGEALASEAIPVGISPDGTSAYLVSEDVLSGEEETNGKKALSGALNLYAFDGSAARFVAILDPEDFLPGAFGIGSEPNGRNSTSMSKWISGIKPGSFLGRANTPTRATPDGKVFVFQSHAQLTDYDNRGVGEIYRYAPDASPGQRLLCVSCDPAGGPPRGAPGEGDAMLQIYGGAGGGVTLQTTLVPNVTDDGTSVFFQSPDRLVPEDANTAIDVYQWKARGSGVGSEECQRSAGCLSLISSGQGELQSSLYGMSADGSDVFISTLEKLVSPDLSDSYSLYDARVEGGIPDPPVAAGCQGDACQGEGAQPPALAQPATSAPIPGGNVTSQAQRKRKRCPKGKHKARQRKGKGKKVRCVKKKGKKHHRKHHRHNRRARR